MQEALFTAVALPGGISCLAAVYAALQAGASVEATDEGGRSVLHIAAYENEDAEAVAAVLAALVGEGADPQVRVGGGWWWGGGGCPMLSQAASWKGFTLQHAARTGLRPALAASVNTQRVPGAYCCYCRCHAD